MKLQTVAKTGEGSSAPIVIDTNKNPVNIGFAVIKDGTVNYTVQHTFDDPAVGFSVWFSHPTVAAKDANAEGSYTTPITAVRVTMNSGTGSVTLKLLQAGVV